MVFCVAVIIALLAAMSIGRYAGAIGSALKLMDHPDSEGGRKRHVRVTPLVGGVGVTIAALVGVGVTLLLSPALSGDMVRVLELLAFAVAAMFLLGAADDRYTLGPRTRLIGSALILLPVVCATAGFTIADIRFTGLPALTLVSGAVVGFALLCLLALLNAVNMADGKNGVVITLALTWSLLLIVRLPVEFMPVTGAVAAALAVLLFFNMNNRLFLGDGGSYAVSAFFGLLAIYSYNVNPSVHADDVVLMFAIPVFDTARLIVVRSLQRQSPFEGGRDHLHHFLFDRVGWPRGLYIFIMLVVVPNLGSLLLPSTTPFWLAASAATYALVTLWAQNVRSPGVVSVSVNEAAVVPIGDARPDRPVRYVERSPLASRRIAR